MPAILSTTYITKEKGMTTATKAKEKLPTTIGEHETVVGFDESFKCPPRNTSITFDGDTYQNWVYETLPLSMQVEPMGAHKARTEGMKIGDYVFYMRPLPLWRWGSRWEGFGLFGGILDTSNRIPKRCWLDLYRSGKRHAQCGFDREVYIPVLAKKCQFRNYLEPWMSLTPNEILTQRGQVKRGKGNVGIAGLGLGWAARRVLERKQVKHLTVVEKDPALLEVFGTPLKKEFGDKLELVCGDAYEHDWCDYAVSMWDIWEDYGGVAWDRKFAKIKYEIEAAGKACVYWGTTIRD